MMTAIRFVNNSMMNMEMCMWLGQMCMRGCAARSEVSSSFERVYNA